MKRFFLALTFCIILLGSAAIMLGPFSLARGRALPAKGDLIASLLKLPAPAPPNPLVPPRRDRGENFFDRKTPPPDDAPIEDLLDYWRRQSLSFRQASYNPKPSDAALARMIPEIEKEPDSVGKYLNVLRDSSAGADMVKRIYDSLPDADPGSPDPDEEPEYSQKDQLEQWLIENSPHFTADLERKARQNGDVGGYVENQESFHALTKQDWERARPVVDRMYADSSQPASQTLARWALYRNALATGSSEADRFRDELKAAVEDTKLSNAVRDLSLDALLIEKEWSGRDEWYFSLMADETLVRLRPYTGLTTLINQSPDGKYTDKMIEFSKSENRVIRTAAVRNLLTQIDTGSPEVVKALLPWLSDREWVLDRTEGREGIVRRLTDVKLPESVPALIAALDEKETINNRIVLGNMTTNTNAYAADVDDSAAAVSNMMSNAANAVTNSFRTGSGEESFPLRFFAIDALANQGDPRAVPALRRILAKAEPYERLRLVKAILACNGYTVIEQADALEHLAERGGLVQDDDDDNHEAVSSNISNLSTVGSHINDIYKPGPATPEQLKLILGTHLRQMPEISDALVRELIVRIERLEKTDPPVAEGLRRMFVSWSGTAVNALLLRDLKNDKSNVDAVIRLLALRRELREKQPADVFDLRTGSPTALGISACLLESERDSAAVLNGQNDIARTALLACARLIRAPLPLADVARHLNSGDKRLSRAAELYLESEDSSNARAIVLSRHPDEAKVMGATTAFWPDGSAAVRDPRLIPILGPYVYLWNLQGDPSAQTRELAVRDELKKGTDLAGVYLYGEYSVRIHNDRVMLQWTEDESRYRERPMTGDEFRELSEYLQTHGAAELPPFLDCAEYNCHSRHLVMAAKSGGWRVFSLTERMPKFFAGLDAMFAEFRKTPGRLRYDLEKQLPGLEIVYSNERMAAETVWKNGADLRVLVADRGKRLAIERELKKEAELLRDGVSGYDADVEQKIRARRDAREFDEFAWFEISSGELGSIVSQPMGAEYIPATDAHPLKPEFGNWAARTGALELRADNEGLYLINGGKMSRVAAGHYYDPVITSNGKWAIATKYSDEDAVQLVRINLATRREFPVKADDKPAQTAVVFVPALNRVLVAGEYYDVDTRFEQVLTADNTYWLDPETGALTPVKGEVAPLGHQSFRQLQPTGKPGEAWAAVPDNEKNLTKVGLYDSRALVFKPVLEIPKIRFNSMDMWVDAPANKVYFVYNGHLLALPLQPAQKK